MSSASTFIFSACVPKCPKIWSILYQNSQISRWGIVQNADPVLVEDPGLGCPRGPLGIIMGMGLPLMGPLRDPRDPLGPLWCICTPCICTPWWCKPWPWNTLPHLLLKTLMSPHQFAGENFWLYLAKLEWMVVIMGFKGVLTHPKTCSFLRTFWKKGLLF